MISIAVLIAALAAITHPRSPTFLGFLFSSRRRSEALRAPPTNWSGTIARAVMTRINRETSAHVVTEFLDVRPGQTVIEVGPGSGHALRAMLGGGGVGEEEEDAAARRLPKKVVGIEISAAFRSELFSAFRKETSGGAGGAVLDIVGEDAAAYLKSSTADGSIDRILASNVIYFLDPLDAYLEEFYRVLRPGGGKIVFAVKDAAKVNTDPSVFVNLDWDECVRAMEEVGLRVERGPRHLDGRDAYWPIIGTRE